MPAIPSGVGRVLHQPVPIFHNRCGHRHSPGEDGTVQVDGNYVCVDALIGNACSVCHLQPDPTAKIGSSYTPTPGFKWPCDAVETDAGW